MAFSLRRPLLALFIVALVGGCSPKSAPSAPDTLRVVSWNIEWFPGGRPEATPGESATQMASAKQALAELKPDILLLQEIRDWQSAAELCRAIPGLEVQVASNFDTRPQNQVVASKIPADSAWSDVWKKGPIEPPRGYAFAALRLADGRHLLTYSLHLKSNRGQLAENLAMRQESSRQLLLHVTEMLELYRQRGPVAVIIGGDLNTSLDDPRFAKEPTLRAWQKAGLHWTHQGVDPSQRVTIPASGEFPDNCFDHLFTGGLGLPVARVKSFPKVSDHNPVILDLDLKKADFLPKLDLAVIETLRAVAPVKAPLSEIPVDGTVNANDTAALSALAGRTIGVRGMVGNVGETPSGSIAFINFEGNARGHFVAIVRQSVREKVVAGLGGDLKSALVGKQVEIRGEIVMYNGTPQIAVTASDQIQFVEE